MTTWTRKHHNILAKMVREVFPIDEPDMVVSTQALLKVRAMNSSARTVLALLALDAARRFKEDNPKFDHLKWLDQCSPDPLHYPLSELWEDFMVRADGSED